MRFTADAKPPHLFSTPTSPCRIAKWALVQTFLKTHYSISGFKYMKKTLIVWALLATCGPSFAAAILRVTCEDEDAGAEIQINGKFRGECPTNIQVPEGTLKLRVIKPMSATYDYYFEQEIRLTDNTIKKVDVVIPKDRATMNARTKKKISLQIPRWQKKAMAGDLPAMLALVKNYSNSDATPDADKALQWARKAADAGSAEAMYALGDVYKKGKGVEPNEAQATQWYAKRFEVLRREAEAGNAISMRLLAGAYATGKGVATNPALEKVWESKSEAGFMKLADEGNLEAMEYLYVMYVFRDKNKSSMWESKLVNTTRAQSEAGNAAAMLRLARMYELGDGVEKNKERARAWLQKSAAAGNADAQEELEILAELKKAGFD